MGQKTGTVSSMKVLKPLVFAHTSKQSLPFAMHFLPEIVTAIIYYSFILKLSLQPNPLTLSNALAESAWQRTEASFFISELSTLFI